MILLKKIQSRFVARILEIIIIIIASFLTFAALLLIKPIRELVEKFFFYLQK